MRVLFATMQAGPGYFQGTERYLATLMDAVSAQGHECRVIAGDPLGIAGVETPAWLSHLPTAGFLSVRGVARGAVDHTIADFRPDVVHVLNPAHIGVGCLERTAQAGVPIVVTVMDFWWLCPTHTLMHAERRICPGRRNFLECARCITRRHESPVARAMGGPPWVGNVLSVVGLTVSALRRGTPPDDLRALWGRDRVMRDALGLANKIIFPSSAARELVGPLVGEERGVDIPYGVAAGWFDDVPAARGAPPDGRWRIGYAGALVEHKGVSVLIDAVRSLGSDQVALRIAGDGASEDVERLKQRCEGIDAAFVGRLDERGMVEFLDSLDVLVVPSLWPENLPIVTLEAAARRVPTLASRVAGTRDRLSEDCLFDVGSGNALAARLAEAIDGRRPIPLPEHPPRAEEMAEATLRLYKEVVRSSAVAT